MCGEIHIECYYILCCSVSWLSVPVSSQCVESSCSNTGLRRGVTMQEVLLTNHSPYRLISLTQPDRQHHLRCLAGPSKSEMPLHSTHIGNRCTQPIHKSQTTSHSIVSTLRFEKSPLAVAFRRGVAPAFQNCTRRLVQSGVVSATGSTMETTDAKTRIQQLDTTDTMRWEEDQELVDLAIVWALQHGLVSRLF